MSGGVFSMPTSIPDGETGFLLTPCQNGPNQKWEEGVPWPRDKTAICGNQPFDKCKQVRTPRATQAA